MSFQYYQTKNQFIPDQATLKDWLNTKKSNSPLKPGFFETVDEGKDTAWTVFALFVEVFALVTTLYFGYKSYEINRTLSSLIVPGVVVFFFIAFDVLGILFFGHDRENKVVLRGRIKITQDPLKLAEYHKELNQFTLRQFFGVLFLSVSALLKIFGILMVVKAGVSGSLPAIFVMTIFYATVVYIHIAHSGYYFARRRFTRKCNKEWNAWWTAKNAGLPNPFEVKGPSEILFSSSQPMTLNSPYVNGFVTIVSLGKQVHNDGSVTFDYKLGCWGCLWDDEIRQLSNAFPQNGSFQADLIKACISLQLSQAGF
jgi:hypothetical protein